MNKLFESVDNLFESGDNLILNEDSNEKQQFIEYCKDKIKDLGQVPVEIDDFDSDEDGAKKVVKVRVAFIDAEGNNILDPEDCLDKLDSDEGLCWVNPHGEFDSSPMSTPDIELGELTFTAINKDYYDNILEYWDDFSMDEVIGRTNASNSGNDKIDSELDIPEPFKYNVIERNGGADVEIYHPKYNNLGASTTTMDEKGNYVQDYFDIDGLWEVSTIKSNGDFDKYVYVTGWQEVVKTLQNELSKLSESDVLTEDELVPVSTQLEYTGGGITLAYGKFSNGTYFTMGEDYIYIYDEDESKAIDELDGDTYDWEQEHLIDSFSSDDPRFKVILKKVYDLCDDSDKDETDLFHNLNEDDSLDNKYKVTSVDLLQTGGYVYNACGSLSSGEYYVFTDEVCDVLSADYAEALNSDVDMYDFLQENLVKEFSCSDLEYLDFEKQIYDLCDDSDKDSTGLFKDLIDTDE